MKINWQYQDLHMDTPKADWVEKQQVERDICLLYHQQSCYSSIMGDLYFGTVYALPYWEYLKLPNIDPDDQAFIRDGCLVMILAMASGQLDGATFYLAEHIPACQAAIAALHPVDERTLRLVDSVKLALAAAAAGSDETPEIAERMLWAHREYVQGYFRNAVNDFDHSPYFQV